MAPVVVLLGQNNYNSMSKYNYSHLLIWSKKLINIGIKELATRVNGY
jgi:hypothetical protein